MSKLDLTELRPIPARQAQKSLFDLFATFKKHLHLCKDLAG